MTKKDMWISLFIISSIAIVLSLWLTQGHEVSDYLPAVTDTAKEKNLSAQAVVTDKKLSHNTVSKNTPQPTDDLIEFRFALLATSKDIKNNPKALISINQEESQWFFIGDKVITTYVIHDINSTYVTLFEKSGAYYEISLYEP